MKLSFIRVSVATAMVATLFSVAPIAATAATYTSTVDRVVDGDTVYLQSPVLGSTKIRMLGIDAAETNYYGQTQGYHGEAAKAYLTNLLPSGTAVTVETDVEAVDGYGRLLAHVFKGNLDVNKEMVAKGYAVTYYIWPNSLYFTDYQNALVSARNAGLGIWNPSNPLTEIPFEFRDRVSGTSQDKYVGDYFTKKYVDPANYKNVPIENRMFFLIESGALAAGYTKDGSTGGGGSGTTPPPGPIVTTGLYVNEVLAAPSSTYTTEWIEIYNANDVEVDLSGYLIDDLRNGGSAAKTIPTGTKILAKGYYVMQTSSYFNNSSDEANLLTPNGTLLDSFSYSSIKYDQSWARTTDGGTWGTSTDATPTKGTSNN